jgi:kumamolisin
MGRLFTKKPKPAKKKGTVPFLLAVSALLCANGWAAGPLVPLSGHIPHQISVSAKIAPVASTETIHLSLVVNLDQNLMSQTLAQIYNSGDPLHRNFLTPAQFAQKFNLAQKRQALKSFAQSSGLSLDSPDNPYSQVVHVSGSALAVENALSVHLSYYRHPSGQVFRANDSDPMIPASLSPHLLAVLGLSNFRGAHQPRLAFRSSGVSAAAPSGSLPKTLTGTGPGGGLAPADIESIYGLSGSLNGSGQTLALLELDGYIQAGNGYPSDLSLYESQFSLPTVPVSLVEVDGQTDLCGPNQSDPCNSTTLNGGQPDENGNPDNGMTEVALDLEMMAALASGASNILVYMAPNSDQGIIDSYNSMASQDQAQNISTSWGEDEEDAYVGSSSFMSSENSIFQQMATQGQTIFSAAGDAGAYDASGMTNGSGQLESWDGNLLTDDPASQPYVTGVGGTSLSGTLGGPISETVWNEGCPGSNAATDCAANGAGGGGVANYPATDWPLPSYQNGITTEFSSTNRNVPDVALNADPNNAPYSICIGGTCNNGNATLIGGTSAAAPLWAAMTARVNQLRSSEGFNPLGFANPTLYTLASGSSYNTLFNDITSGNNGYYSAGTGYDNASGWGSFKGNALINALSPLPAPQNVSTSMIGLSSVTWTWSPVVGVSSYNVYSATVSPAQFLANLPPSASSFTLTGLPPNTTEALTIGAVNVLGDQGVMSSPSYAVTLAPTLTQSSSTPAETVFSSSISVTYAICSNCEGYLLETSTAPDFTGVVTSSLTENTQLSSLVLPGLYPETTYYLRLGALNWALSPNYISLSSTATLSIPQALQVIASSGGIVSFLSHNGLVTLNFPPNAFGESATVTVDTPSLSDLSCVMPPGKTMTDEGVGIAVSLNPAIEPSQNVEISISYANAVLPPGVQPANFLIARCDLNVGTWIPLISNSDVSQNLVTAATDRFSTFEIMGIGTLASSVQEIQISNNPIRPARGITDTTFSNLPANASLTIYTISGLLVKKLTADATGVAKWDATNSSGRMVASGVYFVLVRGNGTTKTLKIAVQR